MEMVVVGWLVLELTDSPVMVGLAGACRFFGMGLGPLFGAVADRFNRKRTLLLVLGAGTIYPLIIAVLYFTSVLEIWHIFVLVLFGSLVMGFDMVILNALVADVTEPHSLTSAVGMIRVSMSFTSLLGPLIGGYLYDFIGVAVCFPIISAAYLCGFLSLLPMRLVSKRQPPHGESLWQSVARGIVYIKNDRAMIALMIFAGLANLFIFPSVMVLMPVFAREVLGVGVTGLGILLAAQGAGRMVGAFVTSTLGRFRLKGWFLIAVMVAWPALFAVFATLRVFSTALAVIAIMGAGQALAMSLVQILLLMWSSEEYRGRVMGIRMFVVLFEAIGSLIAGMLTGLWGISSVMLASAVTCVLASVVTSAWAPELRRRPQ
jgi:MFS family permease